MASIDPNIDPSEFLGNLRNPLKDSRTSNKAFCFCCCCCLFLITLVYMTSLWCQSIGRHDWIFSGVYSPGLSTFMCILILAKSMTQECRPAKERDWSVYGELVSITKCSNMIGCKQPLFIALLAVPRPKCPIANICNRTAGQIGQLSNQ